MSPNDLARLDQEHAREREFERRVTPWLRAFLVLFLLAGVYSVLALLGVLPALPWSPLGVAHA